MASQGKEGVTYCAGAWEHGQLGLPFSRDFNDPESTAPPKPQLTTAIPSTGPRITDKGKALPPIPAVDEHDLVSHPVVVPLLRQHHIVSASAGGDHTLVITNVGRVFAFGRNDSYQLGVTKGEPTYLAASTRVGVSEMLQEGSDDREVGTEPIQITSLRWKQIVEVSCGDAHNLARGGDGAVYAWGLGASGRLGLGHFKTVPQPTQVDGLKGMVCTAIAAGFYHSLALMDDGSLYSWGSGDGGQLGDGKMASSAVPVAVPEAPRGQKWGQIAAGEYHSIGVTDHGNLVAWGLNNYGQLGLEDFERRASPTTVPALSSVKVTVVSCGPAFNVVVSESTQVLSWGQNTNGQLGHGDTDDRSAPTAIFTLRGVALRQVRHVVCLDAEGRLWAWGGNEPGCLCDGLHTDRHAPFKIPETQEMVLDQVECGYQHTILVSAFSPSEVQSRLFYLHGLLHLDDPLEDGFCLYTWDVSGRYYPASVVLNFYEAHNQSISHYPIFVVDPKADARLEEVMERLLCLLTNCASPMERVRLLAVGVFYELGGAHSALNDAAAKHVTLLMQRLPKQTGIVPLGSVRIGDSRHRAALFKLLCDRIGIPCALVRGAVPVEASEDGFFDLSRCSKAPNYPQSHHWNIVRLEEEKCYLIDTVGLPSDIREVENSDELLMQLGKADKNKP